MDTDDGDRALTLIGDNMRAERARRKLTQQAVAERAKLQTAHYSRIERGTTNAGMLIYIRIARALGVDIATLVSGVE
ncbi:MAG: helix-turn-helix transcriptional regulator [Nocardioides sp.]|uniref:helix-turn-helix domain-containing protein n=1 Tax=Nocardioides sp. TaxID=35761 RepID=UPI0039E36F21